MQTPPDRNPDRAGASKEAARVPGPLPAGAASTKQSVWVKVGERTFIVRFEGGEWVDVLERKTFSGPGQSTGFYNRSAHSRKHHGDPQRGRIFRVVRRAKEMLEEKP